MRRLLLALLTATAALLPAAAPAAASAASCSASSARPGELHVAASGYLGDAVTSYRFYVSGPETRTVYEGRDGQYIDETLTGLLPGSYAWIVLVTGDNGDGTIGTATRTLGTCTVYGSVSVPSLRGMTADEAASALAAKGLKLGSTGEAYSDSVTAGLVSKQSPAAGSELSPGDAVSITVSKGAAPATPKPTATPKASATPKPVATATPSATATPEPSSTPLESASPSPTGTPALVAAVSAQTPPPAAPVDPRAEVMPLVDLDLSNMGAIVAGGLLPLTLLALFVALRRRRAA